MSLTDTASRLRAAEERLAAQPVEDTQKVEAISKAITEGSYQVEPKQVADKMVQFENQLNSLYQ